MEVGVGQVVLQGSGRCLPVRADNIDAVQAPPIVVAESVAE